MEVAPVAVLPGEKFSYAGVARVTGTWSASPFTVRA